jgi:D-alanine-D-alanine ligase
MLRIPYSGSDPLTLAVALDKTVTKTLVAGVVAVPAGCTVPSGCPPERIAALLAGLDPRRGPWFVKPAFEGSSKGIREDSLVHTLSDAAALAHTLVRDYEQPILVEEFIAGEEVTVGIVGNGHSAEVIGTMHVQPRNGDRHFIYSLGAKRDWDARVVYEVPARLPAPVTDRLVKAALAVYETLGCRDVARIDFRVRDGVPFFLEANPLPGLAPDWSDLVLLAKGLGVSHADLIRRILHVSLLRVGLAGGLPQ